MLDDGITSFTPAKGEEGEDSDENQPPRVVYVEGDS